MKKNDFELVPSSREETITPELCETNTSNRSGIDEFAVVLTNNMGSIIELARDIAEIKKFKVQSEVLITAVEKKKELIIAEAEAYVRKKTADSQAVVDRMEMVRLILKDYYVYNAGKKTLNGEEFVKVINEVLRGDI